MSDGSKLTFGTDIAVPRRGRLSEYVADAIIAQLAASDLKAGDRLPTEPELESQFDVSRSVIREATRILVDRGVVTIRPRKGMVVADFDGTAVARQFELLLQLKHGSFEQLMEMRLVLEVGVIEHAAHRHTAKDRKDIEAALANFREHETSHREALEADLEFHVAVARASHNPFFVYLINPINDYLRSVYSESLGYDAATQETFREHTEIAEAIFRRDAAAAGLHAREHLLRIQNSSQSLVDGSREKH